MSVERIKSEWEHRSRNKVGSMTTLPEGFHMTIVPQAWIPVSERLPDDDAECLVVESDGTRRVARFDAIGDGNRPSWYEQAEFKTVYPVAWMPMPEPPEVK